MKTRGRPKGSEKDDSKALSAIADMIYANSALKPTTAIRRHNSKVGDAEIRRLQDKWRRRREALLAEAADRAEANAARAAAIPPAQSGLGIVADVALRMAELYDSPVMRASRGLQHDPSIRALVQFQNSPEMRLMREALDGPAMKLMRQVQSDPAMRLMREIAAERRALRGW